MKLQNDLQEFLEASLNEKLQANDQLIVVGHIGLMEMDRLLKENKLLLQKHFNKTFINEAEHLFFQNKVDLSKLDLSEYASTIYEINSGGVLSALYKIAQGSRVGLEINMNKIPIFQETIEIMEFFNKNPYEEDDSGAYLVATKNPLGLIDYLKENGISGVLIGYVTVGESRRLHTRTVIGYLNKPNLKGETNGKN